MNKVNLPVSLAREIAFESHDDILDGAQVLSDNVIVNPVDALFVLQFLKDISAESNATSVRGIWFEDCKEINYYLHHKWYTFSAEFVLEYGVEFFQVRWQEVEQKVEGENSMRIVAKFSTYGAKYLAHLMKNMNDVSAAIDYVKKQATCDSICAKIIADYISEIAWSASGYISGFEFDLSPKYTAEYSIDINENVGESGERFYTITLVFDEDFFEDITPDNILDNACDDIRDINPNTLCENICWYFEAEVKRTTFTVNCVESCGTPDEKLATIGPVFAQHYSFNNKELRGYVYAESSPKARAIIDEMLHVLFVD